MFFSPDASKKALVPDWMRNDLNKVAIALYKRFLNSTDLTSEDKRNAESVVKAFRQYQLRDILGHTNGLFNATVVSDALTTEDEPLSEELREAISAAESFRSLLGKVATDFADKMLFEGGTKYLYQARMWAEVFESGDAVLPHNYATSGAFGAGIVFTHIPRGTTGSPGIELLDPRGHNPPFGRDQIFEVTVGNGYLYPGWLDRMTMSHRCCNSDHPADPSDLLTSHRIDWAFEIGLFQYPEPVLNRFFDLERCPFQEGFRRPDGQLHFDLEVEELVKLQFPGINAEKSLPSTYNN